MTAVAETTLNVHDHPAVRDAVARRDRARADADRIAELAREAEDAVARRRAALASLEVSRSVDPDEVPQSDVDAAARALRDAEAKAEAARAESDRRAAVSADFSGEIAAAYQSAAAEVSEAAGPLVREMTEEYLEALAHLHALGLQVADAFETVKRGENLARNRHGVAVRVELPHGSPVRPVAWTHDLVARHLQADHYFAEWRERGYDF